MSGGESLLMAKMVNPLQVLNKNITSWLFAIAILFFVFGRGPDLLTLFDTNFVLGELSSMIKLSHERNDLGHLERVHSDSYLHQLDRSRTNRTAVMAIGNLAFLQGKREEATIIWQEFGIPSADALKLSGDYANSQNYYYEALNLYTQAVNYNPDLSEVWYAIGVLQQEQNQFEAAIEAYETSWSLRNSKSIEPLGMLYHETGKYELAIEVWEEALQVFPQHPRRNAWWRNLLFGLRSTQQWQTMLRAAQTAIAEFPGEPQLYIELGFAIQNSSGSIDEAVEAFKWAIKLDESLPGAYTVLGNLMVQNQQFDEAFYWYSEAIQRDPENASVYILQANMFRTSGNIETAIDLYLKALGKFPANAEILYELAWAYRLRDDKAGAITTMEEVISSKTTPEIKYLLRAGLIYEWAAEWEKAVEIYKRVLSLEPGNETAVTRLDSLQ